MEIDPLVLIGAFAVLGGATVAMGIAYGKVVTRLHHLESNPLLRAWSGMQDQQAIAAIQKLLDEWRKGNI